MAEKKQARGTAAKKAENKGICLVREHIMIFIKNWVHIRRKSEGQTAFISPSGHQMRQM